MCGTEEASLCSRLSGARNAPLASYDMASAATACGEGRPELSESWLPTCRNRKVNYALIGDVDRPINVCGAISYNATYGQSRTNYTY